MKKCTGRPVKKVFYFLMISFYSLNQLNAQLSFTYQLIDGNGPSNIWGKTIGDLNNDGLPDFVAGGNSGGGLVWYENPSFTKRTINSSNGFSTDIEVYDIDRDGNKDVITIKGTKLVWYKNPGWTENTIEENRAIHDIVVADINNDGHADVIARNQGEFGQDGASVFIYTQTSEGLWILNEFTCPDGEGVYVGYIDSDNLLDIVVNNKWYKNTGNMSSWQEYTYSTSWTWQNVFISVGDINGDGRKDIVLTPSEREGDAYHISWFEKPKNPTATWTEHIIENDVEAVYHFVGIADFNLDGKNDFATAEMTQGEDPDNLLVYINQDNGTNWETMLLATTGSHSMRVVDYDMDGDYDLFGANWNDNKVELWINELDTTNNLDNWQRHEIDGERPYAAVFIQTADLDGDNKKEIITGGWWYKQPNNLSDNWTRYEIGSPLKNMAIVYDFDGDNHIDILGTGGEGSASNSNLYWAKNNGTGGFTVYDNIQAADGDFLQGTTILLEDNSTPYQVALSWHIADKGIQTIQIPEDPINRVWQWEQISTFSQDEAINSGDIDRDGDQDLLLGTYWLKNTGSGWEENVLFETNLSPDRNVLADMNNDGRLDAVVGYQAISTSGILAWYEQPIDLSLNWYQHVIAEVVGPMSLDVHDMDADGDLDVVVGEHNLTNPSTAKLMVFENTDGKGLSWYKHLVYEGDEHHDGAIISDIDNDGDFDIVSIGWGHNKVLLYENTSPPVIQPNESPELILTDQDTLNYSINSEPISLFQGIIINDNDNDNLYSATLTIEEYSSGGDTLIFTPLVSTNENFQEGTYILSGEASLSDYQSLIRSVKYLNKNSLISTQSIVNVTVSVSDEIDDSNVIKKTISFNEITIIDSELKVLEPDVISLVDVRQTNDKEIAVRYVLNKRVKQLNIDIYDLQGRLIGQSISKNLIQGAYTNTILTGTNINRLIILRVNADGFINTQKAFVK